MKGVSTTNPFKTNLLKRMNRTKISVLLVLLGFYFSMAVDCYPQSRTEEERNWLSSNFMGIREELFPLEKRPGTSIGYRNYRDLYDDELEYSFVFNFFWKDSNPKVTVTIRTPEELSVISQIIMLHRQYPELNATAIKNRLKIKEIELEENKCPEVRTQYNKFYQLVLQTRTEQDRKREMKGEKVIFLHPTVHIIKADISGGEMNLVLDDPDHPFVKWIEETKRILQPCIRS